MKIKSYKKNGKTYYEYRAYIGYENGKRKYRHKSNFKTKKEAELDYYSFINGANTFVEKRFSEVFEEWKLVYVHQVRESTYNKVMAMFKNHINPLLGDMYLSKINYTIAQTQF